jgi:phosphopantetheine--protein transferase-like protein
MTLKQLLTISEKICLSATQIRTGIDFVYTEDIHEFVDSPIDIILTEAEWQNIAKLPDRLQRIAGRFACKEAILKVLGHGIDEIELVDIEILNDSFGKPIVYLQNSALHYWRQIGFSELDVSITHHKDYAVGMAVAIKITED